MNRSGHASTFRRHEIDGILAFAADQWIAVVPWPALEPGFERLVERLNCRERPLLTAASSSGLLPRSQRNCPNAMVVVPVQHASEHGHGQQNWHDGEASDIVDA